MSKSAHMTPAEAKLILQELEKRAGQVEGRQEVNVDLRQKERSHKFMQALHPKQLAFALDPSRRKAALCTRRAGKTTVASFMMCRAALEYDRCLIPYVSVTLENAKKGMWRELKDMNRRWNFGMEFNETSTTATFPNGSQIWLLGVKHADDMERLRGAKYPIAVIDEAASIGPHLDALLTEVVAPALRDYMGSMVLIGTPGRIPAGIFYEATTSKNSVWSVHRWSLTENPFLPPDARDLAKIRAEDGMAENDPRYRREYLGEWVIDDNNLVYKFKWERNTYVKLPEDVEWNFNLGVDLGFDDDTAFVVGAYSHYDPNFYVLETFKAPKMDITSVANKVKEFEQKYAFARKVIDAGALGKMINAELASRHGVHLDPAEKKDKLGHIENFNSDLLMGRIKVPTSAQDLHEEWTSLPWHENKREEHPKYANHLSDACLYAWRDAKHYAGVTREVDIRTPEQRAEDEYEQRLAGRANREEHWYDLN